MFNKFFILALISFISGCVTFYEEIHEVKSYQTTKTQKKEKLNQEKLTSYDNTIIKKEVYFLLNACKNNNSNEVVNGLKRIKSNNKTLFEEEFNSKEKKEIEDCINKAGTKTKMPEKKVTNNKKPITEIKDNSAKIQKEVIKPETIKAEEKIKNKKTSELKPILEIEDNKPASQKNAVEKNIVIEESNKNETKNEIEEKIEVKEEKLPIVKNEVNNNSNEVINMDKKFNEIFNSIEKPEDILKRESLTVNSFNLSNNIDYNYFNEVTYNDKVYSVFRNNKENNQIYIPNNNIINKESKKTQSELILFTIYDYGYIEDRKTIIFNLKK